MPCMLAGVTINANGVIKESPKPEEMLLAEPSLMLIVSAFFLSYSESTASFCIIVIIEMC